jgi:hypothetical protein
MRSDRTGNGEGRGLGTVRQVQLEFIPQQRVGIIDVVGNGTATVGCTALLHPVVVEILLAEPMVRVTLSESKHCKGVEYGK